MSSSVDVLVVGAGLSGLVAATSILRARPSTRLTVVDARDRVGGRLLATADGADLGGSWVWPTDRRLQRLAARLGVEAVPQRLDGQAYAPLRSGGLGRAGDIGGQIAPCGPGASRWQRGAPRLPVALAGELPAGSVWLGCSVSSVEREEAGGGVRVGLSCAGSHGDSCASMGSNRPTTILARRVVLAIPPEHVAQLRFAPPLPDDRRRRMAKTGTWASDWSKVVATFKSAFWRQNGDSGALMAAPGSLMSVWWESGGGAELGEAASLAGVGFDRRSLLLAKQLGGHGEEGGGEAGVGQAVGLAAGEADARLRALVGESLGPAFGRELVESELTGVAFKSWIADPLTHVGGADKDAGDPRRMYGHHDLKQQTGWGVHFAGTETEAEAGHMEGAVIAGERAAQEVLEALDQEGATARGATESV